MVHDEFKKHGLDEILSTLPNNSFSKNFIDTSIKQDLIEVDTYWESLYGTYEVNAKNEVKKFISLMGEEFKNFLLFVPKIIKKEFSQDKLLLKMSNDYNDQELLIIYIKTSYPPQKTADKINKIEDEVFLIDNSEILNYLEISVEF
ncbi:MAG: hypothetical protein FWH29_01865 [Methanobrevibacter sp.]|nr:hypothetical protein [Methanobrevibacter sp.]